MTLYTMQNPTFVAYTIAAAIMILKIMGQGWLTVYRMMKVEGGYLNPEDLLSGPINRNPRPGQLDPNDYVDRSRRMHLNDLENIPAFLVAGWLLVAADPPYMLAVVLMGGVYGFAGPIVAGLLFELVPALLRLWGLPNDVLIILFGVGVLQVQLTAPAGIAVQLPKDLANLGRLLVRLVGRAPTSGEKIS